MRLVEMFGVECSNTVSKLLDLTKACDRIEQAPLFHILLPQGSHCPSTAEFTTDRPGQPMGVESSPLNPHSENDVNMPCEMEGQIVSSWVQDGHGNASTNIRYADVLVSFAASSDDLSYMLEVLAPEVAISGLLILTACLLEEPEFGSGCGKMVQIVHADSMHKYLGG